MKVSQEVTAVLVRSGWWPGRRIGIDDYMSAWKAEGYTANDAAIRFATELGNLRIVHKGYSSENSDDESIFDPRTALDTVFLDRVAEDYQPRAAEQLCPVGVGFSEHFVYLISPTGAMYGGFDSYFCRIGRDVNESLNNIFFDHKFESI